MTTSPVHSVDRRSDTGMMPPGGGRGNPRLGEAPGLAGRVRSGEVNVATLQVNHDFASDADGNPFKIHDNIYQKPGFDFATYPAASSRRGPPRWTRSGAPGMPGWSASPSPTSG